jgi:hypothetical protein
MKTASVFILVLASTLISVDLCAQNNPVKSPSSRESRAYDSTLLHATDDQNTAVNSKRIKLSLNDQMDGKKEETSEAPERAQTTTGRDRD